jgi:hypothetical protein
MRSSGLRAVQGAVIGMMLLGGGAVAHANTMTFGSGGGFSVGSCCTPAPFSEDGINVTPTPAPSTLNSGTHFDVSDNSLYGGTSSNRVGVIHRGNGGEQVTFTFGAGNFDLISLDLTGWDQDGDPTTLTGQFKSSSGATFDVTAPTLLSINFAALTGWANISFFTFTVPVGVDTCGGGVHCAGVGFDNIVMNAPGKVPVPAALPLFISGLAGLVLFARRRRAAA